MSKKCLQISGNIIIYSLFPRHFREYSYSLSETEIRHKHRFFSGNIRNYSLIIHIHCNIYTAGVGHTASAQGGGVGWGGGGGDFPYFCVCF